MDKLDRRLVYSVLIFMVIITLQKQAELLPYSVQLLLLASILLFSALVVIYCFTAMSKKIVDLRKFDYVFYVYLLLAAVSVIAYSATADIFEVFLLTLFYPAAYFILYIIVFLIMSIGAYFALVKKNYKIGFLLFTLVFLIIAFYSFSKYIRITTNDEGIITFYGTHALLSGTDPYSINESKVIYYSNLVNETGYSFTTNNSVIGTMVYPSLFFLSFVPFYLLSSPLLSNFVYPDLTAEQAIFVFILLLVVWYVIDKKEILKPKYLLFGALAFFIPNILSVTTLLMLAVILLAYAKLGSKYSWIFLGLALSIQEELWIPVLLLIAYSFNTYGLRKGVRDLLGSAGVFLLLNGYFILLNPGLFIQNVFQPVSNVLIPTGSAAVGFFVFMNYTIALSAYSQLYVFAVAAVLLVSLYFNNKKAIPVLCMIPYLFLSHGYPAYYYFLAVMLVVIMYLKPEKSPPGILRKFASQNASFMYAFAAIMGIVCIAPIALMVQAHANYVNTANLSISNQLAYFSDNTLYYNATLTYNYGSDLGNKAYVLLNAYSYPNQGWIGTNNVSILNGAAKCAFPCSVNINVIPLSSLGHTYSVRLVAFNASYQPYESMLIYSQGYAYNSGPIKVEKI